ncbi:uncharacterized protein LOC122668311 [Telopea speciosissima]|uniref:uncharacterized protein LOC122668311 n=1 Tax=Telopea speciosissima TaxID=54955 RepID=UPI001CC580A7|nr:uncharacterized protein LOC122668311 [Telopea speciosissima]
MVYALNRSLNRIPLWEDIRSISLSVGSSPWGIGGDFNVVRFSHEKLGGSPIDIQAVTAFNSCLDDSGLNDLRWSGDDLSWHNKRSGIDRVACKLDRVLVNDPWLSSLPSSNAFFDLLGLSNHSPISLFVLPFLSFGPKPFKFFNMWTSHPDFLPVVQAAWGIPVFSFSSPLLAFSKKLKNVKMALKSWNSSTFSNISSSVSSCRDNLSSIQLRLQSNSLNPSLAEEEVLAASELSSSLSLEESFLK